MTRFLATIVILACTASACSSRSASATDGHAHGRTITLTDEALREGVCDTIRFGRLYTGETAAEQFTIVNATAQPVAILRTESSCTCSKVDCERRPIPAGGSLEAECTFDSRGAYGWQLKVVRLTVSGAEQPIKIFVEAEVAER